MTQTILYVHYANPCDSSFLYKKIGISVPSDILFVFDGERESIYVPNYEYAYFKEHSKISNVFLLSSLIQDNEPIFQSIEHFLGNFQCSIFVPSTFPLWLYSKFKKSGMDICIKDSFFIYFNVIKDSNEIKIMKRNASLSKQCFLHIEQILKESEIRGKYLYYQGVQLTSHILRKHINLFMAQNNLICPFPIIAGGKYGFFPHFMHNHSLQANLPIIIDLSYKDIDLGYYADVTRTYIKGSPPKELVVLYNEIFSLKEKILSEVKPGVIIAKIYDEFEKAMRAIDIHLDLHSQPLIPPNKSEYICHHAIGHGIGRDLHELPVIHPRAKTPFESGMTIAFEPGAYNKHIGGIRIEDTYLITASGCINLTKTHYNFIIY